MTETPKIKVALIITTYNWPAALERVLSSVQKQTHPPTKIVVADDGSGPETAALIQRFQQDLPLEHAWQEDIGFRAAASRNNALRRSHDCDYLITIDGDMLLHPRFVEDHLHFAKSGQFIQGGRVLLGQKISADILANGGDYAAKLQLWSPDLENRKNTLRLPWLARKMARSNDSDQGIRSCNMSFWKQACFDINGYNEALVGWGREDSEFASRLIHSGQRRINLRFCALAYHLYHPHQSRAALPKNDAILHTTRREKIIRCTNGLVQDSTDT